MTKRELEKAIENGESVWYLKDNMVYCIENKFIQRIYKGIVEYYVEDEDYYDEIPLFALFKTKAEAEHYLHHANISRTEHLPFLTWEEFKEGKELRFYNGKYRYKMNWSVDPEIIVIKKYLDFDIDEFIFNERLTEANFYKAYDECVRLFRSEE